MKLQLNEVLNLFYEINGFQQGENKMNGLLKQSLPIKQKFQLQKLSQSIEGNIKLFDTSKKELYEKYGEEEEGNYVIKNNQKDFLDEHNSLLMAEIEVDKQELKIDDFAFETHEYYPTFLKLLV